MLDGVRRTSDDVHLELAALVFDGRLAGRTLAGTVASKAGSSVGSFTLTRPDPPPVREGTGP